MYDVSIRIWNGEKMYIPEKEETGIAGAGISDIMLSTGKRDIAGKEIYAGDIIENPNKIRMVICFGEYQACCPADKCYMENIGFFATGDGLPDMPIGPLEEYAKVIGNVHENPELIDW